MVDSRLLERLARVRKALEAFHGGEKAHESNEEYQVLKAEEQDACLAIDRAVLEEKRKKDSDDV